MNKILKTEGKFKLVKGFSKYWVEKRLLFWRYKLEGVTRNKKDAIEYFEMIKDNY